MKVCRGGSDMQGWVECRGMCRAGLNIHCKSRCWGEKRCVNEEDEWAESDVSYVQGWVE